MYEREREIKIVGRTKGDHNHVGFGLCVVWLFAVIHIWTVWLRLDGPDFNADFVYVLNRTYRAWNLDHPVFDQTVLRDCPDVVDCVQSLDCDCTQSRSKLSYLWYHYKTFFFVVRYKTWNWWNCVKYWTSKSGDPTVYSSSDNCYVNNLLEHKSCYILIQKINLIILVRFFKMNLLAFYFFIVWMFRIEGTGEEIKGVVQKLTPRGNFRTQTGVRFRVLEKRAEGNGTHDSKADSFRETMVYWDV